MDRRFVIRLTAAAVVFALLGMLAIPLCRYLFASQETRVERVIHAIARAAEKSSPRGIIKHFHPEFQQGEITRQFLRAYLQRFFITFENVRPHVESVDVTVDGDRAWVEVWAGCTVTPKNRTEPESLVRDGDIGLFEVEMRKVKRRWYITRVDAPRMRLI